jgi:hypothetical protein
MMYSDLHTNEKSETSDTPEAFKNAEDGEFEEYNFEKDYGTEDAPTEPVEPSEQNEDAEKTGQ